MEVLCLELEAKYVPWTYTLSESAFQKITSIYQNLNQNVAHMESILLTLSVRAQALA